MDKWKDTELAKMKVGGNDKARKFMESQPDFNSSGPISQKYNTRAAELWRDKVKTESEGNAWDPSKAKVSESMLRSKENRSSPALLQGHNSSSSPKLSGKEASYNGGSSNHSYSSNNDVSSRTSYNGGGGNDVNSRTSYNGGGNMKSIGGGNGNSYQSNQDTYTYGGNAQLQARDQFLSNKMEENQTRSDAVPPSQGGKYVGFGSTPTPQPKQATNEYMDTLSYWGSALATGATQLARAAGEKALEVNENYIKPSAAKVMDPEFQSNVKQSLSSVSHKAVQLGSQGANMVARYSEKGWNSAKGGGQSYSSGIQGNSYSNTGFGNSSSGDGSGGGGSGSGYQSDTFQDPTSLSSGMSNMSVSNSYSSSSNNTSYSSSNTIMSGGGGDQGIFGQDISQRKSTQKNTTETLDDWLNEGWDDGWKDSKSSKKGKAGSKRD